AEVIKSPEQQARYGGTAGTAFDSCYHKACDGLDNIDMDAFDVNIDVIAHAVGTYAWDLSSLQRPVPARRLVPARHPAAQSTAGAGMSDSGSASGGAADAHEVTA
ncbi:hypothetical protein ACFQ87_46425, partial [Kitasatospora sp. NPDC056531]